MTVSVRDEERLVPILAAWAELDGARALHTVDHDVIRSTESARSLVLDLFVASAHARDLFNACARLGSLMAEAGASPSLAAGVIDSAAAALSKTSIAYDASRKTAATASLVEGYVAAIRDAERMAGVLSWEYPACVVPLDNLERGTTAIACGYPIEDGEALAGWAGRVASRLSKDKTRRVVLSGAEAARMELASALELVGIEVLSRVEKADVSPKPPNPPNPPNPEEKSRGWLRLPWRK